MELTATNKPFGTRKNGAVPFTGGRKCYACDAAPVGYAQQGNDPELLPACARHVYHSIKVFEACAYCHGPIRSGSLTIDGQFVHARCEKEAAL